MNICNRSLFIQLREYATSDPDASILVLLDDNFSLEEFDICNLQSQLILICNRIDNITALKDLGYTVYFSDFSSPSENLVFDAVFYRVSKERFVTHHCINMGAQKLKPNGMLFLTGCKEDGIKSYKEKATKVLGLTGEIKKQKGHYNVALKKNSQNLTVSLDDGNYADLRKIAQIKINHKEYTLISKPGVYGWKKIDLGTEYLINTITPILLEKTGTLNTLDLGCGSGHLTLALNAFNFNKITATDNNATALIATEATLLTNHFSAQVIAANCGDLLTEKYDLILCNPPFHKGFDANAGLTETFVKACSRLLSQNGEVYFVTNAFIGIEKLMQKHHLSHSTIANNKQFKVIKAIKY